MQVQIVANNGTYINPPVYVNNNPTSGPSTKTDKNGNQITLSSNGAYTDTLGQTALAIVGTAPNNTTFSYQNQSGGYSTYTVRYTSHNIKTNFNCSGILEYTASNIPLVDSIDLPDGRSYTFTYEDTPNISGYKTGRIASVTLPTGGTIAYTYTGGNNGIECSDATISGLNRSTPDGQYTFSRSQSSGQWTTTENSPSSDKTVITFLTTGNNYLEVSRQLYSGSSTLLETILHCYQANDSSCSSSAGDPGPITWPIAQMKTTYQWPNNSGLASGTFDKYDALGNNTLHEIHDYGSSGVYGNVLQSTSTDYTSQYSSAGQEVPTRVQISGSGGIISDTKFGYDENPVQGTSGTPQHTTPPGSARGNLTSVQRLVSGSNYLKTSYTYYDTGTVYQIADPNTIGVTTYTYGNCDNSFATQISTPVAGTGSSGQTLSTGAAWYCAGGVPSSTTDLNGNTTTYTYGSDPYWRPQSITDAANNVTSFAYPTGSSPNTSSTSSSFYNASSVNNAITTTDGLGRTILQQKQQAPNYGFYDSVATSYDPMGRISAQTLPFTAEAGEYPAPPFSQPAVKTTYDALGRTLRIQDGGGGYVSYTYNYSSVPNDVLVSVGPAPSGENLKRRVLQYNGAGQLALVCEVTGLTGFGACGTAGANGYLTKYTYNGPNLTMVQQNAQNSQGTQTRSIQYDNLGRKTQEMIPEWSAGTGQPGTSYYTYDSDGSGTCPGSSAGDLIKSRDNLQNVTCYTYDSLHRVLSSKVTSSSPYSSVTPQAYFVYDTASYNGTAMQNALGNLAEAYTCQGTCSSKLTDEFFSASLVTSGSSSGGVLSKIWQKTPNSGGYFLTQDTLYPNGALGARTSVLGSASYGYPNMSYGLDGEGRPYWASDASRCINPVTATTYNASSSATRISFGNASTGAAADTDSFQYDPNTNRPSAINYFVNASSNPFSIGMNLYWNPNGSLQQMVYSDSNDTSKNQNCTYAADDLSRIASVNCQSAWVQNFTYDPMGNITKPNYTASYNKATNQVYSGISPVPHYDANGNQLGISSVPGDTISWNAWNVPISVVGTTATYDALGRMVEKGSGSSATQFVFSPSGTNIASVSSGVLVKGTVPLPGGDTAIYAGTSGMPYLRHTDWLGSSRLATTWAHSVYSKTAYAPFGETYNEAGTPDRSFTGQDQNVATGSGGTGIYDFLFRKYDPSAGRWLSPDPSGWSAADATVPQSLNRYAYVQNDPMGSLDPSGLNACVFVDSIGNVSVDNNSTQSMNAALCRANGGNFVDWRGYLDPGSIDVQQFLANGGVNFGYGFNSGGEDPGGAGGGAFVDGQVYKQSLFDLLDSSPISIAAYYNGGPYYSAGSFNVGIVPSPAQTPVHGLWTYGNWCGAGGSGNPINSTDAACKAHDACYNTINLTADQYTSGNLTPSQVQGAAACNQQLCNAALNANRNPSAPFSQRLAGAEIVLFFSLTGPQGARCQGF